MSEPHYQHELIKARLRIARSSLAEIARELEVTPTTVTCVSQGHRRSQRVEAAIATKLSTTPEKLWPDRYEIGCMELNEPAAVGRRAA